MTGPAGTGKSYVLDWVRKSKLRYQVIAPTGVAAANAKGITIQSFFGVKGAPRLEGHTIKPIQILFDVLIVDEVSMVTRDLFAIMDQTLRQSTGIDQPMGNVRLIVMGDFYQLPPTKEKGTEVPIYNLQLWKDLEFEVCYLHYIFRNTNPLQQKILDQLRKGDETDDAVSYMQSRQLTKEEASDRIYDEYVHLFWSRSEADEYNKARMEALLSDAQEYTPIIHSYEYADLEKPLKFKVGARVMCIKNLYHLNVINGQCGYVHKLANDHVRVKMDDGRSIQFFSETWMKQIDNKDVPVFSQIPLQLAWAITISKSQGMTLDKAVVYLRPNLYHGLAYVGISRVRNLDNLKVVGYKPHARVFQALDVPY